jgi:hypothetical protein
MNEDDLPRRIVQGLNRSLNGVPQEVLDRLRAIRLEALAAARTARLTSSGSAWTSANRLLVRVCVPAAVFAAVAAGLLYWQAATHRENVEIEAALLADELPLHAYTDPGFHTWLQHTSYEQR